MVTLKSKSNIETFYGNHLYRPSVFRNCFFISGIHLQGLIRANWLKRKIYGESLNEKVLLMCSGCVSFVTAQARDEKLKRVRWCVSPCCHTLSIKSLMMVKSPLKIRLIRSASRICRRIFTPFHSRINCIAYSVLTN